jgi:hypothetical protein
MLEAFTDPPARSCYFPASKTGMSRFQLVDPDLSTRACARGPEAHFRQPSRLAQIIEHYQRRYSSALNLIGPEKIGRAAAAVRRHSYYDPLYDYINAEIRVNDVCLRENHARTSTISH